MLVSQTARRNYFRRTWWISAALRFISETTASDAPATLSEVWSGVLWKSLVPKYAIYRIVRDGNEQRAKEKTICLGKSVVHTIKRKMRAAVPPSQGVGFRRILRISEARRRR